MICRTDGLTAAKEAILPFALLVTVVELAHGGWCQLVVAERMLESDMN